MAPQREFSHPVRIDPWPTGGISFDLRADPEARRRLARRFGLESLDRLVASGRIERSGKAFLLEAKLRAAMVRTCVVTLDTFEQRIDEPVRLELRRDLGHDDAVDGLEPDTVDAVLVEGADVDLGEVFSEELALRLDPHPRAPGARVEALDAPTDFAAAPADGWRAALARHRSAPTG